MPRIDDGSDGVLPLIDGELAATGDDGSQVARILDLGIVDGEDIVAGLQAGLGGGSARLDL